MEREIRCLLETKGSSCKKSRPKASDRMAFSGRRKMSNGGHSRDGYWEAEAAESEGEQDEDDVYTKGSLRGAAVRLERRLCAFYMSSHMYRGTRDVCVRVHL